MGSNRGVQTSTNKTHAIAAYFVSYLGFYGEVLGI
jgi:hypothetical protein